MRTVATLCATGAGVPIALAGFKLARHDQGPPSESSHPLSAPRALDMSAVATYTVSSIDHHRPADSDPRRSSGRSSPAALRTAGHVEHGPRTLSTNAGPGSKRRSLTSAVGDNELAASLSRPQAWLRRWSSSMSVSRDSSRTPSRPGSAAVTHSNGSVAFSHAGSSALIFPDTNPLASPLPPNKLVKRNSSRQSSTASSYLSPASRLPLPVLRRPATSHQRSSTWQDGLSDTVSDPTSIRDQLADTGNPHLRHYFTPRVAAGERVLGRRRSSTGIPNPIKRVYPHRRHVPVLVSSRDFVRPARLEYDDDFDWSEIEMMNTTRIASSPLPSRPQSSTILNRSFSFGDMLSTGPTPLWRRPSSSRSRTAIKSRGSGQRGGSGPYASMGSSISTNADFERPAKRRDLTDPETRQRSVYSSASSARYSDPRGLHEVSSALSVTPQSTHVSAENSPLTGTPPHDELSSPVQPPHRFPSANADSSTARHARISASQSEITSTVGSDSGRQSVGGYSTDYQSDNVYDSFPTRATRSSSGKRGPPIETIFDDSPPTFSSERSTRLRDFLSDGNLPHGEHHTGHRHSTIEEEGSIISTPVRSVHDRSVTSTPSARPGAQRVFGSSPPAMSIMPDPDEMDWDTPDMHQYGGIPADRGLGIIPASSSASHPLLEAAKVFPFRFSPFSRSTTSTPNRNGNGSGHAEKANLFDWSEQQPSPSHNDSPPRPRTVHGKKDPENRGSRSAGRRAPSGMHARSHSVPVVPDVDGKRPNVVANKFGTWGVGSKAVTEDWNEDFDFDETSPPMPESSLTNGKRIDSAMLVPESIREQQENVVANIGLLREWGLLIEELKDLRMRAFALDMLNGDGPYAQAWKEVDAMIDLADQESEEQTLEPRRSPPSSPGFDFAAFEEPRSTNLNDNDNAGSPRGAAVWFTSPHTDARTNGPRSTPPSTFVNRPRKDSEAVARSVIEALQSKRSASDSTARKPSPGTKKLPFDTATLKHIVPYVNGLKRRVKDGLREKEGLYSSPRRRSPPDEDDGDHNDNDDEMRNNQNAEPAFRIIFKDPATNTPSSGRRMRRETAGTDHDGFDEPFMKQSSDLADRVRMMTLPR